LQSLPAVGRALAWIFVAEQLLVALLPDVGRWTPGGASGAVLKLGELATTRGQLLTVWGGALLLMVYAVVLSLIDSCASVRAAQKLMRGSSRTTRTWVSSRRHS